MADYPRTEFADWREFLSVSRLDLSKHCQAMRDELRKPKRRSPQQRQLLAERCGFLLDALADHLKPSHGSPESQVEQKGHPYARGVSDAFVELYEAEERHLRSHLIERARDVAYGPEPKAAKHRGPPLVGWTYADFIAELAELERVYRSRTDKQVP